MTQSRSKGLLRLRHLQEVTEARGEELELQRQRFDDLAKRKTRSVSSFNLFQTPVEIADRMARLLPLSDNMRILEPSAGLGRLFDAVRCRSDAYFVLVEEASVCAAELYRKTQSDGKSEILQRDFLTCTAAEIGHIDAVIMNPPFKMWRDIKHIKHAFSLLSSGGILVALCASGPKQESALKPIASTWEILPAKSFKKEGTSVNVALLTITKP